MASLNVKTSDGKTMAISGVDLGGTVADFKTTVAAALGVPADEMRMIFDGRVLRDAQPLSAFSLKEGDTVRVVRTRTATAPVAAPAASAAAAAAPGDSGGGRGESLFSPRAAAPAGRGGGGLGPGIDPRAEVFRIVDSAAHGAMSLGKKLFDECGKNAASVERVRDLLRRGPQSHAYADSNVSAMLGISGTACSAPRARHFADDMRQRLKPGTATPVPYGLRLSSAHPTRPAPGPRRTARARCRATRRYTRQPVMATRRLRRR